MCELMGFTAKQPTNIKQYLNTFYSHSIRHPHGWGLMREQPEREIIKEAVRAVDSHILPDIIEGTHFQTTTLAHIRFATVGSIRQENCHPFTSRDRFGREWTLIHNGTIYSGKTMLRRMGEQKGDTDSERMYLSLMDALNAQEHPLSMEERFRLIERFIADTAPRNKLNLMIYDGELLYVHKNMRETLKMRRVEQGWLFATTPIDDSGAWQDFPTSQVMAYRNGELLFIGTKHGGEFVPTLEYITAMDAMNI